jgi:hypothetical protein
MPTWYGRCYTSVVPPRIRLMFGSMEAVELGVFKVGVLLIHLHYLHITTRKRGRLQHHFIFSRSYNSTDDYLPRVFFYFMKHKYEYPNDLQCQFSMYSTIQSRL